MDYKDKNYLIQEYVEKKKSTCQIAEDCKVNAVTIFNWLRKYSIPTRPQKEATATSALRKRRAQEAHKKNYADPEWLKQFGARVSKGKSGVPLSEAHKKALQKTFKDGTRKSIEYTQELRKKLSESSAKYWKGKKLSASHCKKLSLAHIGLNAGDKHPNWKGGKSGKNSSGFTHTLKREVRERDGHICQKCGMASERLDVHHKDLNRQNNDMENLETLCAACHGKIHSYQGHEKRYGVKEPIK